MANDRRGVLSAPTTFPRLRGILLSGLLALTGCVPPAPPVPTVFAPLNYDYLTKIPLNVAQINIDDTWQPPFGPGQVGDLSPVRPVAALQEMATDRLLAAGNSGRAIVKIEDASIVQLPDRLQANFAVQLTVATTDGARSGYAEARVVRSLTFSSGDQAALRAALYDLTRSAMDDMNVEFEFQIRRSLRDYLRGGPAAGTAPLPPPVQRQSLSGPSGEVSQPNAPNPPEPYPAEPPSASPLILTPPPLAPPPSSDDPNRSPPPGYLSQSPSLTQPQSSLQPYPPVPPSASAYPAQSYPQPYPAQPYPAQTYPAQTYPSPSYPAPTVPVQAYPSPTYSQPSYSQPDDGVPPSAGPVPLAPPPPSYLPPVVPLPAPSY